MELNEAKKDYNEPMHTAEHILNQTMIRMFQCNRSFSNHIERKKSKCDYYFHRPLNAIEIQLIEQKVNEIINSHYIEVMSKKIITIDITNVISIFC